MESDSFTLLRLKYEPYDFTRALGCPRSTRELSGVAYVGTKLKTVRKLTTLVRPSASEYSDQSDHQIQGNEDKKMVSSDDIRVNRFSKNHMMKTFH